MAQIVAGVLGVPMQHVRVAETSTEVVPNTSKTAAAAGTDVNGGAVLAAARELASRLQPFREKLQAQAAAAATAAAGGVTVQAAAASSAAGRTAEAAAAAAVEEPSLAAVAQAADAAGVNLSAGGHRVGIDKGRFEWLAENDVRGWACNYFAWGGSACMVEVDTLTGEVTCAQRSAPLRCLRGMVPPPCRRLTRLRRCGSVLSADVVLDAGASINPAVDAGQVEGGFVQSVRGPGFFSGIFLSPAPAR